MIKVGCQYNFYDTTNSMTIHLKPAFQDYRLTTFLWATMTTAAATTAHSAGMAILRGLVAVLRTAAVFAVVGAAAVIGGVYFFQKSLIYAPNFPPDSRQRVARPDQFGMTDYETVKLKTPDGVLITGYLILKYEDGNRSERTQNNDVTETSTIRQRGGAGGLAGEGGASNNRPLARRTILYLQANAGNIGHRLPIARIFWNRFNCNVMMISYRGYGHSEGSPDERGLKIDAQVALDYIKSHPRLKDSQVIVYGQSIGGAVAIQLAANDNERLRIDAVIVENTFLSLPKLVPHVLKFIGPLSFLCHQIWDSESAIQTFSDDTPVLFLSGARDELVPPSHMHGLFHKLVQSRRSRRVDQDDATVKTLKRSQRVSPPNTDFVSFAVLPDGTHSDTCIQPDYFDIIAEFLAWAV